MKYYRISFTLHTNSPGTIQDICSELLELISLDFLEAPEKISDFKAEDLETTEVISIKTE